MTDTASAFSSERYLLRNPFSFPPRKIGIAMLAIEIRSGQRIVFSKTISMNIASDKEMNVLVEPEILPSGIENTVKLTVKDKATGAEIEGALAKAKDRFGTVVSEKNTNGRTTVTFYPEENVDD